MRKMRYFRPVLFSLVLLGIALLASGCGRPETADGKRPSSANEGAPESPATTLGAAETEGSRKQGDGLAGQEPVPSTEAAMSPLVPELRGVRLGMRRYEVASTMGNPDTLDRSRLREGGYGVVMTYMDGGITVLTDSAGHAYQFCVNVTRSPRTNYPGKVLGTFSASSTPDDVLALYSKPYSRSEPPAPAILKYATPRGFVNFVWRGKGTEGEGQLLFVALAEF
jgi:hypothetical protein